MDVQMFGENGVLLAILLSTEMNNNSRSEERELEHALRSGEEQITKAQALELLYRLLEGPQEGKWKRSSLHQLDAAEELLRGMFDAEKLAIREEAWGFSNPTVLSPEDQALIGD